MNSTNSGCGATVVTCQCGRLQVALPRGSTVLTTLRCFGCQTQAGGR